MAQLDTDKLKGTALCKAKVLKDFGLRFFAKSQGDPHLSTRCVGCNLNVNYGNELCRKLDDTNCGLKLEKEHSVCKTLTNQKFFRIDLPIAAL